MSRFLRSAARRNLYPSSSSPSRPLIPLINGCQAYTFPISSYSSLFFQSRPNSTHSTTKSLFESNILRFLNEKIEYLADYTPPLKPETNFNSFLIEDHPGKIWITLRRKLNDGEEIKIEATMFDGCITVPRSGDGEDLRLHISVLVDVYRGNEGDALEFACSAWPNCLEIRKVYFRRGGDSSVRPYIGPDFGALKSEIKQGLKEFLEERGVSDELSVFLHEYVMNKDKFELIQWFEKLKSFVEK